MINISRFVVFSFVLLLGIYAGTYEAMAGQKEQLAAPVILSIDVDGNRHVEKETILAKLHTAIGQRLDRRLLSQDVRRLVVPDTDKGNRSQAIYGNRHDQGY